LVAFVTNTIKREMHSRSAVSASDCYRNTALLMVSLMILMMIDARSLMVSLMARIYLRR